MHPSSDRRLVTLTIDCTPEMYKQLCDGIPVTSMRIAPDGNGGHALCVTPAKHETRQSDRSAPRHAAGSSTSKLAGHANVPRAGGQRRRVLDAIAAAGAHGATRDELAATLNVSPNSIRPRVAELVEGGWVIESGKTRRTANGEKAATLVLTSKGDAQFAATAWTTI